MNISETKQRKAAKAVLVGGKSKAQVARELGISSRSVGRYVDKYRDNYVYPITAMSKELAPHDEETEEQVDDAPVTNVEYSFSATPTSITIMCVIEEEETKVVNISKAKNPDGFEVAKGLCFDYMVDEEQSHLKEAFEMFDVRASLSKISHNRVTIDPSANRVFFTADNGRDYDFSGVLVTHLVNKVRNGADVTSLMNFIDKLSLNPVYGIVDSVYEFLEACEIEIDGDGDIIAYKKVTPDFKDVRTQTFDNSIGAIVKEERNQVDPNPSVLCGKGLHVCSLSYVPYYPGDVIIRVKIDPRDVCAIPEDYYSYDASADKTRAKMRVCEYKVLNVVKDVDSEFKRNR